MSDRELACIPTAAALVAAVRSRDGERIAHLLAGSDLAALVVVLADRVNDATGEALVTRVLSDLRDGDLTLWQVGHRYALSQTTVRHLAADNNVRIVEPDEELRDGEWQTRKGVQVWVGQVAS